MRNFLFNLLLFLISSLTITMLTAYINFMSMYYEMSSEQPARLKYQYILVGTGTAGSMIMADIPSDDVLILEAGLLHSTLLFDIPILTPILHKSSFDWDYLTETQKKSCLGLNKEKSHWTKGKVFGGSHMLNNLIHFRGFEDDYKGWFGEPELYNYDTDVLPYFLKSELFMSVEPLSFSTKIANAFLEAGKKLLTGSEFFMPKLNQKNGSRWTTSHYNYKYPRDGHQLLLNARVIKIIFDKTYKTRAIGVEYITNGKINKVFATKGVILSAGVIETPKLLMLSGIGPKKELNNLSIPIIKDLPVGQNLQDHVTTGMDLILINQSLEIFPMNLLSTKNLYDYIYHGKGPLTFAGCDAIGFVNTQPTLQTVPDLSFMLMPVGISNDAGIHLSKIINLKDSVWNNYFRPLVGKYVITILPILLHPKSTGYVKLRDNNPLTPPIINPRYFHNPNDIKLLIKGLHIIEHIIKMPTMQKFGAEINPQPFPGCNNLRMKSYEYWECYIRQLTLTMYHPVGTCRMGHINNSDTVVSQKFLVHGIENLYVVDASVMPNLPSGNPNAAIAMLAQRFLTTLKF